MLFISFFYYNNNNNNSAKWIILNDANVKAEEKILSK